MFFYDNVETQESPTTVIYQQKSLMTASEYSFYQVIKDLEIKYKIVPQLNLASITKKILKHKFQNELYRNVDFAIFTNDYSKLLLLIELNDRSHQSPQRQLRDQKVKKICDEIGVLLMTFYTNKPNEKSYVINRILSVIEKDFNNQTQQK